MATIDDMVPGNQLRYWFKNKTFVIDEDTSVVFPWDPVQDQPLDIHGQVGQIWLALGRPKPKPYTRVPGYDHLLEVDFKHGGTP